MGRTQQPPVASSSTYETLDILPPASSRQPAPTTSNAANSAAGGPWLRLPPPPPPPFVPPPRRLPHCLCSVCLPWRRCSQQRAGRQPSQKTLVIPILALGKGTRGRWWPARALCLGRAATLCCPERRCRVRCRCLCTRKAAGEGEPLLLLPRTATTREPGRCGETTALSSHSDCHWVPTHEQALQMSKQPAPESRVPSRPS